MTRKRWIPVAVGPSSATPSKITRARARCSAGVIGTQEAYAVAEIATAMRTRAAIENEIRFISPFYVTECRECHIVMCVRYRRIPRNAAIQSDIDLDFLVSRTALNSHAYSAGTAR